MGYKVLNMRCLLQNLQTVLKGSWTQTQRCLWGSNWCHGMQLPHEGSCRDGWKIRAAPFSCMCPGLAAQKEQLLVILTYLSNDFELFWVGLFCWSYCHVSVGHLVHSERQDITYLSLFFGLPGWLLYLLIPFSPFWLPVLHLLPSSLIILLSSTISDVELGRLSGLQFEQLSATQRALLIGSPGAVPFGATERGSYTEGMLTHVSLKTIEQTGASLMYFTD